MQLQHRDNIFHDDRERLLRPEFLVPVHAERMQNLIGKVALFAIDKIKKELAVLDSDNSQALLPQPCQCAIWYNYHIPCFHRLSKYWYVPLQAVPKRWHLEHSLSSSGELVTVVRFPNYRYPYYIFCYSLVPYRSKHFCRRFGAGQQE